MSDLPFGRWQHKETHEIIEVIPPQDESGLVSFSYVGEDGGGSIFAAVLPVKYERIKAATQPSARTAR